MTAVAVDLGRLRDRWEFAQHMLAARDGKAHLPDGYLAALATRTGKSRTELKYRAQFAERYPTEAELVNAIDTFGSWYGITQKALKRETAEPVTGPLVPVAAGTSGPSSLPRRGRSVLPRAGVIWTGEMDHVARGPAAA